MRTAQLIFALVAFSGCSSDVADRFQGFGIGCNTADDCPTGNICIDLVCVPNTAIGPEHIDVELSPPTGSPYVRTQFLDATAIGGILPLELPTPVEFEVSVLDEGAPIGATIAVFGGERIPYREVDVTQVLNPTGSILRLLPGTYNVRLIPDDRDRPGFEAPDFFVRNGDTRQTKQFEVPAKYRTIEGFVVSGLSGSTPLSGVLVRAVGQKSGLPSTEAITDATGQYVIELPQTSETQFSLSARTIDDGGEPRSWSFQQLIKVEEQVREKQIEIEPTSPNLRGFAKLRIIGFGAGGPVSGANVTLTATTSNDLDTRFYQVTGTTDENGYVISPDAVPETPTEIPLLAERYEIEVRTPERSTFAARVVEIDFTMVSSTVVTEQLVLLPRTSVSSQIVSASGSAISNALIEFFPIDPDGAAFDGETNVDGTFTVDVDPGRYWIVIRPQQNDGEGHPVHMQEVMVDVVPRLDLPQIQLPVGSQVLGTVKAEHGDTIEGARVEFFVRQASRTISIARTLSDAEGNYGVVLPNPVDH